MPYQFTQTDEFVHIEWSGEMTDKDLVALGQQMPQLATKIGYAPNVLHTFDQVTATQIKPWSIFEHSLRQKRLRLKNPIKCAWVVRTPEVRRMGRLAQELNRNPNLTLELFDSLPAAKTWLRTATKAKKSAPPAAVVRSPASSGAASAAHRDGESGTRARCARPREAALFRPPRTAS